MRKRPTLSGKVCRQGFVLSLCRLPGTAATVRIGASLSPSSPENPHPH